MRVLTAALIAAALASSGCERTHGSAGGAAPAPRPGGRSAAVPEPGDARGRQRRSASVRPGRRARRHAGGTGGLAPLLLPEPLVLHGFRRATGIFERRIRRAR